MARKLVAVLDEEIRDRGFGSIRGVDRAVGRSEGWWQHHVESGDIGVGQLLAVLDHLGLDPVAFLRRALGAGESLELDRPCGAPPEIVTKAWERVRSGVEGSGVGEAYLTTLDQQRYEKPAEVLRMALWAVEHVELALMPRLLGVAGSAWRLLIELEAAAHAIHAGLGMAEKRGDRSAVGDLLQRLSYVVADRGEHAEALRIAERAAIVYLRAGDRVGMAKALVDQGIWLSRLGRPQESIAVLKVALRELPQSLPRSLFSAFQILALSYRRLGNLDVALQYLSEAEKLAACLESMLRSKIGWLKSEIYTDLGELDRAESELSEVFQILRQLHPGETALVTCDLVRIQLLQGRNAVAHQTATSMLALLEPLQNNKIVSAAISDLIRCSQAQLTPTIVQRVKNLIDGERQLRKTWLSLATKRS